MKHELAALRERVLYAHTKGYAVAYAAEYVADLGGGPPPDGVAPYSTGHLLHLIRMLDAAPAAPPAPVEEPVQMGAPALSPPVEIAPQEIPVEPKKAKRPKK